MTGVSTSDSRYSLVTEDNSRCSLVTGVTTSDSRCLLVTGVELKESFNRPIQEVGQALDVCDGDCPNLYFTKCVHKAVVDHEIDPSVSTDDGQCHNVYENENGVDRQCHPLVCSNDGGCCSKIRVLRDAATHYPLLTKVLHLVRSSAVNSRKFVQISINALLVITIPLWISQT